MPVLSALFYISWIVCDLLSNRTESQQPENNTASPLPPLTDGRDIPSLSPQSPLPPQTAGVKLPSLPPPFLSEIYSCHCGVLGTLDQSHVDLMQVFSAPGLQTTTLLEELEGVQLRKVSRVDDTKRSPGQEILFYVIARAMSKRRHLLEPSSDDEDDHDSEWED